MCRLPTRWILFLCAHLPFGNRFILSAELTPWAGAACAQCLPNWLVLLWPRVSPAALLCLETFHSFLQRGFGFAVLWMTIQINNLYSSQNLIIYQKSFNKMTTEFLLCVLCSGEPNFSNSVASPIHALSLWNIFGVMSSMVSVCSQRQHRCNCTYEIQSFEL